MLEMGRPTPDLTRTVRIRRAGTPDSRQRRRGKEDHGETKCRTRRRSITQGHEYTSGFVKGRRSENVESKASCHRERCIPPVGQEKEIHARSGNAKMQHQEIMPLI